MDKLHAAGLFLKAEKCEFDINEVEFLGFHIGINGIAMDKSKVESIINWPVPKTQHDIQVFLGFANFHRRFIPSYSLRVLSLTSLLKKGVSSNWNPDAELAFNELKKTFL